MKRLLLYLISICTPAYTFAQINIGFLIVGTGKYIQFIKPLIQSARTYFCRDCKVTYYVFTDGAIQCDHDIVHIYQKHKGWPYATLLRCKQYYDHQDLFEQEDYLFACDADMRFVDYVGTEILSERVGTQHISFLRRRGTYEENPCSTAYVRGNEGSIYYAGGFYGGSRDEFITIAKTMLTAIEQDLENNYIAIWHDESHLNRYFINNPPTLTLPPLYCYPRRNYKAQGARLLALNKNHAAMRK